MVSESAQRSSLKQPWRYLARISGRQQAITASSAQLDQQAGARVAYIQATAESTGLDTGTADIVAAGQCWHWFDRVRATEEAKWILRPDGRLVIAHFDWLPLAGSVVEATEGLIERYNPSWHLGGGMGMYPQWLPGLSAAGLAGIETFSYDLQVPYTHEAWRGRIRASAGIVTLDAAVARSFDEEHATLLAQRFPSTVLEVPHRTFAVVARIA